MRSRSFPKARKTLAMGTGSKKHKGAAAKAREKAKGKNQGPKKLGVSKPPRDMKSVTGGNRTVGKKAKKLAAREAAWELIGGRDKYK